MKIFNPGEKVFLFLFQPGIAFWYQEAEVVRHKPTLNHYKVKLINDVIAYDKHMLKRYPKGKVIDIDYTGVNSEKDARSFIKKHSKEIIKDMFKRIQ